MLGLGLLFLGLVLAIVGANRLVDGASVVAKRFNVSDLVIGAIVVGFGTSMPECTVNVISAVKGHTGLAISNVLGSNLFNIMVILGVAGVIAHIPIAKPSYKRDLPFYVIAALLIGVCGNKQFFDKMPTSELNRSDGIVFLMFFLIFVYATLSGNSRTGETGKGEVAEGPKASADKTMPAWRAVVFIVVGLVALVGGGVLIVEGAVKFAKHMGVPQNTIGMLIVGPGTSFPELIATVVAVIKRKPGLGVGNVIGSNLFNIFFVLGVSAVIHPLPLSADMHMAVRLNILMAVMLAIFGLGRRHSIGRVKAAAFLILYGGCVVYMLRGA